jgi:hypothetical protein
MKILNVVAVAALSLSLAGCVVSEQQFVKFREIVRTRPDVRAKLMARCIAHIDGTTKGEKREVIAALIDAKASTLSSTVCRRIERAFVSGRMTYQDYRNLETKTLTARNVKLLRGQ